ncbi:opine metallophore biosynthesis dehydrogenase [Lysinibacillus sp. NPDC056959]|uniref:opine metallophore biosynthesis dehydrogenase n=1 Tax=Lysinibacillus sp. NPDC056959 TaxID=3345981 RepID=UPI0036251CFF
MTFFKKVLLLGTGPTSVQLAVNFRSHFNSKVGIAGRESSRSNMFFEKTIKQQRTLKAHIQNKQHQTAAGECVIDCLFKGYNTISGDWDTIVLSVTTDAYMAVLSQIDIHVLKQAKCIILISPTFGSNQLIFNYLKQISSCAEVISLSTYYGDTRWLNGVPSNEVLTTGIKKTVYIGSNQSKSEHMDKLSELFNQLGIYVKVLASPLEAETRNISLYVHPALFMNDFSLKAIFEEQETIKYVYKLYPEGPITYTMIRHLLNHWKEMMKIVTHVNIQPLNLLKFMVDDNYSLQPSSIARQDVEDFEKLESIHQEYLLYIRYASLLIDPFSKPDQEGRYFDFSAVPIKRIFMNHEGIWDIPRMPKEDYYRLKIIQGVARALKLECPTIDQFIFTYEQKLKQVVASSEQMSFSEAFQIKTFSKDINMICKELI